MKYENIKEGIFLSRPNRFIAEVLVDGKIVAPENGYVYTSGIKATGFADEHTVEVVKGTNTVSKVTYNVNAYIAQKWDSENMKNLVQALACFGAAAKAYK